jgi:hypothetical protein
MNIPSYLFTSLVIILLTCLTVKTRWIIHLELREAWVKASIEHRILRIRYFSKRKREVTIREVEPDFFGYSKEGSFGCWAFFDYLRRDRSRCFKPDKILEWKVTRRKFNPSRFASIRRWRELIPLYQNLGLDKEPWPFNKLIA